MIRVAYFIDTFAIGGAETVMLNLAARLADEPGFEPIVVHGGAEAIVRRCRAHGLRHLDLPAWRFYKKTLTLPLFSVAFARFLKRHAIDVLHSHLFGPVTGGALAARLSGVRHIGTLHDTYTVEERPARARLLTSASRLGTRLVTVSRSMEDYYRGITGLQGDAIRTIYNGVRPCAMAGEAGGGDGVRIVCVARLVGLKRHDRLILAMERLADLPCRLTIVGDGPERDRLEELAGRSGQSDRIEFVGERDDVPDILATSDVFALASETEGLSCSILEAMAAGLPIVATKVGGNHELVESGVNGFLVDDEGGLADALRRLIGSVEMRRRMGAASLDAVRTRFDWEETFDSYRRLYRR